MSDTKQPAPLHTMSAEELRARRERANAALAPARAELRTRMDDRATAVQERERAAVETSAQDIAAQQKTADEHALAARAAVEKRSAVSQHPGFNDGWGKNSPTRQAGHAVERAQRERLQSGAAAAELPAPRTFADAAAAQQARPAAVPSFASTVHARERSIER